MMGQQSVQLRRITHFAYGEALADASRADGPVAVYGSNGEVGRHDRPNTRGPALIIGRKGSFGKVQYSETPAFAIDTTFFVDSTQTSANLRWLYYALTTLSLDSLSEDVGVPGLSRDRAYEQRLPFPPLATQRAIADYLDAETARIDALIEKKRRLIELLEEHLQAFLDEGVVPANAEWTSLRRYAQDACDGPFGSALKSEHYSDEGARVIRLGNIGRAVWRDDDVARVPIPHWHFLRRHDAKAGDLVVAGLGDEAHPVGRACVLPDLGPSLVKADCYRLRLRPDTADASYLAWFLSSSRGLAGSERIAEGSTRPRLTLTKALSLKVPVVGLACQRGLAKRLDDEAKAVEVLRLRVGKQVNLLCEHRQALITAAVTGELEIPGAAA